MKKIIITTVAVAGLLTSAQADFSFGDMFKEMKEAALTLTKDSQKAPEQVSNASKTAEESATKKS